MGNCPSCSTKNPDENRFCASCGRALRSFDNATISVEMGGVDQQPTSRSSKLLPPKSVDNGQFLPGTKIADRYRIVSILGKGGMGEVYRADDLKLGHPVALKFLSIDVALDPRRIEFFHSEVRLSRQISHPNVCRVFDIGEVNGQHFLSMEFIDGEDLRRLLRRIGRLPKDKGIDVARQMCAALAAAHNKSVLHRDLKPANVMLDGRGLVRVTDFGLARLVTDANELGVVTGTPAYMAPEQFANGESTIQSDVYSLGMILYELFTGVAVNMNRSIEDLRRSGGALAPKHPSTIVDDIDVGVEQAILACLNQDPGQRPRSAHAVAAMLPGGSPLDAALAAGETPSPELVAASPQRALSFRTGPICLAAILFGMIGIAMLSMRSQKLIGFDAEVRENIRDARGTCNRVLMNLGYQDESAEIVWGLKWNDNYFEYFNRNIAATNEWSELTGELPTAAGLWFRQYAGDLVPEQGRGSYSAMLVTRDDPPTTYSGMIGLLLDTGGKLRDLQVTFPFSETAKPAENGDEFEANDWRVNLLVSAGIDPAHFEKNFARSSIDENRPPPVYADTWEVWKSKSDQVVVELAALQGRPVFFQLVPNLPSDRHEPPRFFGIIFAVTVLVVFATGVVLARRNWRAGRADRRGAVRMFVFILCTSFLYWLFQAHHVLGIGELVMTLETIARALLRGVLICAAYVGLEPYVRRLWPHMLVGWSRFVAGRFNDPIVGRDALFGVAGGVAAQLSGCLGLIFGLSHQIALDADPAVGVGVGPFPLKTLLGPISALGQICAELPVGLVCGFLACLLFVFILRVVLRKKWLAAIVFVSFYSVPILARGDFIGSLTVALWTSAALFLLFRFGVLTIVIGWVSWQILAWPITIDFTAPNVDIGLIGFCLIAALACYGFYIATAERFDRKDRWLGRTKFKSG